EHTVVGDVAPQEIAPVAEIYRPLRPSAARVQPLDARELQPVLLERRIQRDDGGVRIARRLMPAVGERGDGWCALCHLVLQHQDRTVIPGLVAGIQPSARGTKGVVEVLLAIQGTVQEASPNRT